MMSYRFASGIVVVAFAIVGMFVPVAFAQEQSTDSNTKVEQFEDWEVRCQTGEGQSGCEMTQLVSSPDSGKPILRVVMGYPPQVDTAAMIFILPLGTRLAPGVQLKVDNGEAQTFPFQICLEQGCRADFPVDDDLRGKLRAGNHATVSLIGPRGDRIDLKVSLQGFTDADNRISR